MIPTQPQSLLQRFRGSLGAAAEAPAETLGVCRFLLFGFAVFYYWPVDFAAWADVPAAFWHPIALFVKLGWEQPSRESLVAIEWTWKLSLVFSFIGLWTRPATLFAAGAGIYVFGLSNNFGKLNHDDAALLLVMMALAFSRCGDSWSVESLVRGARNRKKRGPDWEYRWPVVAARVIVASALCAAGIAKLRHSGIDWVTSDNMARVLAEHALPGVANAGPLLPGVSLWLSGMPWLCSILAGTTVLFELSAPLAFFRPLRRFIVIACIGMIAGFRLLMGPTFVPLIVLHLFWVDWNLVLQRLRLPAPRLEVLFDGSCGLCQATMRVLVALDLRGALEVVDVTQHWRPAYPPMEDCLRDMHAVDGRSAHKGFLAYRRIAHELPLAWLALPVLYLPGVRVVGEAVYRRVADNRPRECTVKP